MMKPLAACLLVASQLVACSSASPPVDATRDPLTVTIAPLTLAGIANACYAITVTNQQGQVVTTRDQICADQFGDGRGAVSWVGPCDADTRGLPPGDTTNDNTVTLVLSGLYTADQAVPANLVPEDDYTNPCGVSGTNWDGFGPCRQTVACRENADVAVGFHLTVMRRARQGFFDVAVTFDDVFCSAKLDCVGPSPGLVFDPVSGKRVASFVLGFACTSGTGADGLAEPSYLYLSDVTLRCDGLAPVTLPLATVTRDGNQGAPGPGLVQWMQTSGDEAIGGTAFDKCYWNLAGGLDLTLLAGRTCTLDATGAAATTLWPGLVPPADEVRPVITWSVPVLDQGALCSNHALDADESGVRTAYVGTATVGSPTLAPFVAHHRCGATPAEPGTVTCAGATDGVFKARTLDDGGQAVPAIEVHLGAASGVFALPADDTYTLEGCCLSACCQGP
jgi:hypothetical protein